MATPEATLDPTTTIPTQTEPEQEVTPRPAGRVRKPRERKPRAERAPRAPRPRTRQPALASRLEGLLGMAGMVVMFRCQQCGRATLEGVPELAKALDEYSKSRPAVRRVLEAACSTSDFGPLLLAVVNIAAPIAAHHGGPAFAPLGMLGAVMSGPGAATPPPFVNVETGGHQHAA